MGRHDNILTAVNGGPDNRYRLVMEFDDYAENPREYGTDLWYLRFGGRDFEGLSDYRDAYYFELEKNPKQKRVCDTLPRDSDEINEENQELRRKGWQIVPIYGYSHSGISISLDGGSYPYNCQWDGGMVGFAYLDPDKFKKEGCSDEQAMNILRAEIKVLDYYCQGQCFNFALYEWGDLIESCCGFTGDDREIRRDSGNIFGDEFAPLFDELAYGRIDPVLDYSTSNAAMEEFCA